MNEEAQHAADRYILSCRKLHMQPSRHECFEVGYTQGVQAEHDRIIACVNKFICGEIYDVRILNVLEALELEIQK